MRKLYEIRNDILAAIEAIIWGDDPECPAPDAVALEELEIETEEKLVNCFWAINKLSAEVAEADVVIKSAQDYKKKRAAAIERIKADMKVTMEVMGMEKVDRPDCRITLGKPRQRAEILDESLIPEEYIKIEKKPIKTDILNALKNGLEIPGCKIGFGEPSLSFPKIKGE